MAGPNLDCEVLTPLRIGERACFALTYDRADLAAQLGESEELVVVFSDSRLAYKGWKPLAARVRCDMFADPEGSLFTSKLLDQELRKHPPSRALIDTPLMRRENWWYVPRWIVRVGEVLEVRAIERRVTPDVGVLIYRGQDGITAATISVGNWHAGALELNSHEAFPDGPALVMKHDFTIPDLEERSKYVVRGQISENLFLPQEREGTKDLGPRRKLIQRLREQRQLRRSCLERLRRTGNE